MDLAKIKKELEALIDAAPPESATEEGEGDGRRTDGVLETDYQARGFHLDAQIPSDKVVQVAEVLDAAHFTLETITGVDWIKEGQFEIVYDYAFTGGALVRVVVRTRVERDQPNLPTIWKVFPGANWHERETWDLLGINFEGHPQLERFLLPEDCDFHPLRKDFQP